MRFRAGAALVAAVALVTSAAPAAAAENPRVLLETGEGEILIELYPRSAPVTVANFLRYVEEGRFDGAASFYRVVRADNQPDDDVRIAVVQGGLGFREAPGRLDPIEHETTAETGVRHLDGTISMARLGPGTASSEFFICVGDQPELDHGGRRNPDGHGFAAFGRVVEGMDAVGRIHAQPADGQMLERPVVIERASKLRRGG